MIRDAVDLMDGYGLRCVKVFKFNNARVFITGADSGFKSGEIF